MQHQSVKTDRLPAFVDSKGLICAATHCPAAETALALMRVTLLQPSEAEVVVCKSSIDDCSGQHVPDCPGPTHLANRDESTMNASLQYARLETCLGKGMH